MTRKSLAAAKAAAAEAAAEKARQARRAARLAREEAAEYLERLEIAEDAKKRAEDTIAEAGHLFELEGPSSYGRRLLTIKAKAQDRLAAAQAEIDSVYAEGKGKIDAFDTARAEAKAARAESAAADEEAMLATEPMAPVSVFISRRTQKLHVRRSFEPLFESEVAIRDPDAPIGTTLFTALGYTGKDAEELRWSALGMYPGPRRRGGEAARTDTAAAKAALDRIAIPQEALERINELVTPGSSLIVSDEPLSRETGKGTDFIVVMSGEPQGGIRRRNLRPFYFRSQSASRPGSISLR
jgi:hypothetical protein